MKAIAHHLVLRRRVLENHARLHIRLTQGRLILTVSILYGFTHAGPITFLKSFLTTTLSVKPQLESLSLRRLSIHQLLPVILRTLHTLRTHTHFGTQSFSRPHLQITN